MKSLEQYVRDNKSLFDEEPETGHFERFQQKMERKPGRIVSLRWSISIAASVAILLSATGVVWQYTEKQNGIMVCEEAKDMKICYMGKMNELAFQIEELMIDFDLWDKQIIMNEVQDIIEAVNGDFESELPEELPNEMAKVILSDYYRQNLDGLEMIAESVINYSIINYQLN